MNRQHNYSIWLRGKGFVWSCLVILFFCFERCESRSDQRPLEESRVERESGRVGMVSCLDLSRKDQEQRGVGEGSRGRTTKRN